jgi:hypothetical protein
MIAFGFDDALNSTSLQLFQSSNPTPQTIQPHQVRRQQQFWHILRFFSEHIKATARIVSQWTQDQSIARLLFVSSKNGTNSI